MNKNEIWTNKVSKLDVKIFKLNKKHVWLCNAVGKWQYKIAVDIEKFEKNYKRKT